MNNQINNNKEISNQKNEETKDGKDNFQDYEKIMYFKM